MIKITDRINRDSKFFYKITNHNGINLKKSRLKKNLESNILEIHSNTGSLYKKLNLKVF